MPTVPAELPLPFQSREGRCCRLLGRITEIIFRRCFPAYPVLTESLLSCPPQHLRPGLPALHRLRFARAHRGKPGKQHGRGLVTGTASG